MSTMYPECVRCTRRRLGGFHAGTDNPPAPPHRGGLDRRHLRAARPRHRPVPARRRPRPGARAGPTPARCAAPAPPAAGAAVLAGHHRPARGEGPGTAMRAAVLHAFGQAPRWQEFPPPVPQDGEELIEVTAAPLNNIDRVRADGMPTELVPSWPITARIWLT